MESRENIIWLLERIKSSIERFGRSSRKYIFQGSYDVWHDESDKIEFDQIMIHRINKARELGLIINESGLEEWKYNENWQVTELGEKYINNYNKPILLM